MRFVIYGAGAIGSAIGAELARSGKPVTLIARGEHLAAMKAKGLTVRRPSGTELLPVNAVGHPVEAGIRPGDVVLLTMKSQHTADALRELFLAAPQDIVIASAQNGIANEEMALRCFPRVYGVLVLVAAFLRSPGTIDNPSEPFCGILDIGPVGHASGDQATAIAEELSIAGFNARAVPDIMRWKRAKLLANLKSIVTAITPLSPEHDAIYAEARNEGVAILEAAGLDFASPAEMAARRKDAQDYDGYKDPNRGGGSAWHSLMRGAGSVEADFFSGEIVRLGHLHAIPAPVNLALQYLANAMSARRLKPAILTPAEVLEAIDACRIGRSPRLPARLISETRNQT